MWLLVLDFQKSTMVFQFTKPVSGLFSGFIFLQWTSPAVLWFVPCSFLPIRQCSPGSHLFLISFLAFFFSFPSQKHEYFLESSPCWMILLISKASTITQYIPKSTFLARTLSQTQTLNPKPFTWHFQRNVFQLFQTSHLKANYIHTKFQILLLAAPALLVIKLEILESSFNVLPHAYFFSKSYKYFLSRVSCICLHFFHCLHLLKAFTHT